MIRKIINRSYGNFSFYEKDLNEYLKYEKRGYPFIGYDIKSDDNKVEDSIKMYNQFEQFEYIYQFEGDLFIEPKCGFVISKGKVLMPSIPYYYDAGVPKISMLKLMLHNIYKKDINVRYEKSVISLRDIYETNYFHFFNDVFSKLILLNQHMSIDDLPIVISKNLYDKPFFQGALKRNGFQENRLIIQDNNMFIKADCIFSCKAMPHTKIYYDKILDKINVTSNADHNEKIFITRKINCNNGRFLINYNEIFSLCEKYGFTIVDPGTLNFNEQIDLFSKCRYLIGIHGGGMTNMIYRRENKMSVLEIFPPDNIPPHYYWLTKIFGHNYDSILGDKYEKIDNNNPKNSFILDPARLEDKIKKMLD